MTARKPQAEPHEAADGKFTSANASEAGRKGAQAREANWAARLGELREELVVHAPAAIEGLGHVVSEHGNPKIVPAAIAILDRIGLGPNSKQEVEVTGSERLAAIIERMAANGDD